MSCVIATAIWLRFIPGNMFRADVRDQETVGAASTVLRGTLGVGTHGQRNKKLFFQQHLLLSLLLIVFVHAVV